VALDLDSGEPLYSQLAALLREQITSGQLSGRVPSSKSLAQEHGVSHATTDRALVTLRDEGLIRSSPGKGYYVARKGKR
jgi:DNA-binding transcriptional regulator YhcF (GntR family)